MPALDSLERLYTAASLDKPSSTFSVVRPRTPMIPTRSSCSSGGSASLYDQRLSDPNKAIISHREILDIDANNLRAMRALESCMPKVQQAEPYLQILETQLDVVGSDDESGSACTKRSPSLGKTCSRRSTRLPKRAREGTHVQRASLPRRTVSSSGRIASLGSSGQSWSTPSVGTSCVGGRRRADVALRCDG